MFVMYVKGKTVAKGGRNAFISLREKWISKRKEVEVISSEFKEMKENLCVCV